MAWSWETQDPHGWGDPSGTQRGGVSVIHFRFWPAFVGLGGLTSLALVVLAASGDEPSSKQQSTNQGGQPRVKPNLAALRLDKRKSAIETPTKALIAVRTAPAAAAVNPKVAPGKVRWHAAFAAARAASAKSKRPVLLFHLLGKLDDQFC
jgi:hypothetical protein